MVYITPIRSPDGAWMPPVYVICETPRFRCGLLIVLVAQNHVVSYQILWLIGCLPTSHMIKNNNNKDSVTYYDTSHVASLMS